MKILEKQILADVEGVRITQIKVSASHIAKKALPGEFIVLMVSEQGERIPLTVVDADRDKGVITLIFQEAGLTTKLLGKLNKGDSLYSLVGPLGHATPIKNYGKVILIGGGVGIAEIFPVAKALKKAGNKVITIIGARSKELLILEKELKSASDELYVTTDDGSYGRKGFVTDVLQTVIARSPVGATKQSPSKEIASGTSCPRKDELIVYAVGPIPMMKAVSAVTKPAGIKTVVSLNVLMVDATGMCGCCRVTIEGKIKFSCVDGPEFDAHSVDWDELIKRNNMYLEKEKHICKIASLRGA